MSIKYYLIEMEVTPWTVTAKGGIDYNKLIQKFGSSEIDAALIARLKSKSHFLSFSCVA